MVEYAKTFFRSNCRSAIDAAKIAVNAPMHATVNIAAELPTNSVPQRAIM